MKEFRQDSYNDEHSYIRSIVIDGENCKAIQGKKQNYKIFMRDSQIINT